MFMQILELHKLAPHK